MFVPTQTTNRPAFGWRFLHGIRARYPRRRGGLEGIRQRFPRRRGGLEGLACDCMRHMGDDSGGFLTTPYTPPDASGGPSIYDIQYGAPGVAPTAGTYEQTAGIQAGNIAPVSTSGGLLPTSVLSLPSVGAPGVAPRTTSSLSAYLPWAALAVGGIVLISAVKKK